jgi:crotonobetainyl-CoA:carnitine CoA-transferase CaiB-like acyl-CoA transferase
VLAIGNRDRFSSWTSAQWLADHEEPTRQGSRHCQNVPYQRMQTKDGYLMMVGAAGEAIWARCAKALGTRDGYEDPRFATNQTRMANRVALEDVRNASLTTDTNIASVLASTMPRSSARLGVSEIVSPRLSAARYQLILDGISDSGFRAPVVAPERRGSTISDTGLDA